MGSAVRKGSWKQYICYECMPPCVASFFLKTDKNPIPSPSRCHFDTTEDRVKWELMVLEDISNLKSGVG